MMPFLPDDPDLARRCKSFAIANRAAPVDRLTAMIRARCARGEGHWQEPAPGGPHGRPATHLFEISFLGQTAIGTTPQEAARNWRTCALKQIEGEA